MPSHTTTYRYTWPPQVSKGLDGRLEVELNVTERARAMAGRALDTWSGDVIELHEISGGHSLLLIGQAHTVTYRYMYMSSHTVTYREVTPSC